MRVHRLLPAVLLLGAVVAWSQSDSSAKPSQGFSIDNIDKTLDPCVDFYQYACGNWLKTAEIPPDQSTWVSFTELDERNLITLRGILEKASTNEPNRSAVEQKIGDFYGSCMDEKAVDAIKNSRFRPATLNGQPVPVVVDLVVTFRIFSNRTKPGSVIKGSKETVLAAAVADTDGQVAGH